MNIVLLPRPPRLPSLPFLSALLLSVLAFFHGLPAKAWDEHHLITSAALVGFETRNPTLWQELNSPLEVHTLETFMTNAFGRDCLGTHITDGVLQGVGREYQVRYTEGVHYVLRPDWNRGNNFIDLAFLPAAEQPPTPMRVMSVYSDEPDWKLDDDVPRLRGIGVAPSLEGTGTRVLRHFWYQGESIAGHNMAVGQELDRRLQLYYELSLIAFSINENYWGYRFLGNALHYLEDLTQPFHVRAQISSEMIYESEVLQAVLCDLARPQRDPTCRPDQTLDNQIIRSGWLTGLYHGIYEDFARGLYTRNLYSSRRLTADPTQHWEHVEDLRPLRLFPAQNGIFRLSGTVSELQREVQIISSDLGDFMIGTFGRQYREQTELTHQEILRTGTDNAIGYRHAIASIYDFPLSPRQQEAKANLVALTNRLLMRAGYWSRQLVAETLRQRETNPAVELLRIRYAARCR